MTSDATVSARWTAKVADVGGGRRQPVPTVPCFSPGMPRRRSALTHRRLVMIPMQLLREPAHDLAWFPGTAGSCRPRRRRPPGPWLAGPAQPALRRPAAGRAHRPARRLQRGWPGAFLVDVDAFLPAAAAFAVPLAVGAAQALPAVESESASPGLGHRGLLGSEPYRLGEGSCRSAAQEHRRTAPSLPGRHVGISYPSGSVSS